MLQRGFILAGLEAPLRLIEAELPLPGSVGLPDGLNLVHRVFDNGWLLVDKYLHTVGNVVKTGDFLFNNTRTFNANEAMHAIAILLVEDIHNGIEATSWAMISPRGEMTPRVFVVTRAFSCESRMQKAPDDA